jgi:adenine-specific DNA-methyltransferase
LEWVCRSLPAKASQWSPLEKTIVEEGLVEAAAFLKLTGLRGLHSPREFIGHTRIPWSYDTLATIVDDCPLQLNSPIETLGSIHEQFVTKRNVSVRSSSSRRSTARKTGGVYYTPQPVIDYIVSQTVGRRLAEMTPESVVGIKILDPAAGCGAFLLTTYRYLIDWHLRWYLDHSPNDWSADVTRTNRGWRLTARKCRSILGNHIFGVDLDQTAIEISKRILWLTAVDHSAEQSFSDPEPLNENWLCSNLKQGNSLIGPAFDDTDSIDRSSSGKSRFVWTNEFPQIAARSGFDIVIGNPPYRRERDFKQELDEINATALGKYHSPRMDLWYYFVHRGVQLLRPGGILSFITNAYWTNGTGAEKLIASLQDEVHLDDLFLLNNQAIFPGVSGQHLIFRLAKSPSTLPTTITIVPRDLTISLTEIFASNSPLRSYTKTRDQLFQENRLDVWPPSDRFLAKMNRFSRLIELGVVRQGIAENPAAINQRTIARFPEAAVTHKWQLDEGVFSLQDGEVASLALTPHEAQLLRPYHDLCDLGRYWAATTPSRHLIYSTRTTCPDISQYPILRRHLKRFREILDTRRETRSGSNQWWHLHWPRDERIWLANKLVSIQMAVRPSFVPSMVPTYVSFSANVFVPSPDMREDLRYLSGLLNSRILWAWFIHHAKHRGVGLELNGHVLEQAPIRRIDFQNPIEIEQHDKLVSLVDQRLDQERRRLELSDENRIDIAGEICSTERDIDSIVGCLYGLDEDDVELVTEITSSVSAHK